jgi:multidrug efflux system membrane fusion protein
MPVVPVSVATVIRRDVPVQVTGIGTVEAYSVVSVKSQVDGELVAVHFTEGQEVKAGSLLFEIDPRPFQAELSRAQANLERDAAQLKQAEANLARDVAQEKNAEVEAQRYQQLVLKGVATKEQYDQFRTNAEALQAAVQADQAAIDNARNTITADQAAVETARIQLGYCSIRSPIDGRTGSVLVKRGNLVKGNDTTLVVINKIHPIYADIPVPEQNLPEIRKYMALGKVKVEAIIPNDPQGPAEGVLTFVDNTVDTTTGTIRLKATFANQDGRLWPGQFVNASMTLTTQPNAVVIPSQAAQTGQQGAFVFVVQPDLTVEARPVTLGRVVGSETVVEKGLQPGEKVVTDGQLRLAPGTKVQVKEPVVAPGTAS